MTADTDDRTALERLLRYCARPPFAMDRLRKAGFELVYRCGKQHSEPAGGVVAELTLTPLRPWQHLRRRCLITLRQLTRARARERLGWRQWAKSSKLSPSPCRPSAHRRTTCGQC